MIVNCFPIVQIVRINFNDDVNYANHASILKVAKSISQLFEMDDDTSEDVLIALVQGGSSALSSPRFTPAEGRLIDTIVKWWSMPLNGVFMNDWNEVQVVTKSFVFENHNRAIGVMLHRSR